MGYAITLIYNYDLLKSDLLYLIQIYWKDPDAIYKTKTAID
jgi:hypothetical protein